MHDQLWSKLSADRRRWHSLVDHSTDVAAVMEALLQQPTIRKRLAATANVETLPDEVCSRLVALAFLHDIGKANRGFQARIDPNAPWVGHIDELAWVFWGETRSSGPILDRLIDVLGLDRLAEWFGGEGIPPMLETVFAHHGRPWSRENPRFSLQHWAPDAAGDPVAALAVFRRTFDQWFAEALRPHPTFNDTPAFQHAFAGLVMLADWLGSDERFFPFANAQDPNRIDAARHGATQALRASGMAIEPVRKVLKDGAPDFAAAFGFADPRPMQRDITTASAPILVLEAETGSGKIEAALWRFKTLFEAGEVDSLYFALPTRVAATQMFGRVRAFRDRLFPADPRPGVVLAVPGQTWFDDAELRRLPSFDVQWSDGAESPERWAAEHPKRFLAAPIVVGTVDQALLGAVRVKHAHLRGSLLLRSLLVVDEVHASSVFAGALLADLLRSHREAGGHALLLSATLGAGARAKLLGTSVPDADVATAVPYPVLSWAREGREERHTISAPPSEALSPPKNVTITRVPAMTDPEQIAARAVEAAAAGACVLVIRNTVKAATETALAVETLAGPDSPLLFRVAGVATLHHSRFAPEDRRRLDAAVDARLGKKREFGRGSIVVGSQTLEVSLDLDADLMITDLAPVDVLLQRIGRLHRHRRERPPEFERPEVLLLVPPVRDLLAERLTAYGLGPLKDGRGIYPDLRIIEATWRLGEGHLVWTLPDMNRMLVEAATHPDNLRAIEAQDPRFADEGAIQQGRDFAELQMARHAALDRSKPFPTCVIPRDEHIGTRLGERDRLIAFDPPRAGPFGSPVSALRLPAFLLRGIPDQADVAEVVENDAGLTFRLGGAVFSYDRFGVVKGN